jgi:hypothetical protein
VKALALCALLLAAPACAETYSVSLGGKILGHLSYTEAGGTATLRSTLDNTPLGVFNGTFTGTSTGNAATSRFTGDSRSSRKQRVVEVEIAKSRAVKTAITPADELTDLSDISRVPEGVRDPVRAIGHLFRTKGCPSPLQMYDGRRVVTIQSNSSMQSDNALSCTLSYKVIAGPGHLSPLGISTARMELTYDTAGAQQTLRQMRISSGIFSVSLNRQE